MKTKLMVSMEDTNESVITDQTLPPVDVAKGDELLPVESIPTLKPIEPLVGEEIQEQSSKTECLASGIDEGFEVAETLNAIACNMNSAVVAGVGMSPCEANILNTAVEALLKNIGSKPKRVLPAMENFGGKMSKLEATKLAMESIKSIAISIWEKIKAAFKLLMEAFKSAYSKLFDESNKTKNAVDALNKELNWLSPDAGRNATTPFVLSKQVQNRLFTEENFIDKFTEYKIVCSSSFSTYINSIKSDTDKLIKSIESKDIDEAKSLKSASYSRLCMAQTSAGKNKTSKSDKDYTVTETKLPFGNYSIFVKAILPTYRDTTSTHDITITVGEGTFITDEQIEKAKNYEFLKTLEVHRVLSTIVDFNKSNDDVKKIIVEVENSFKAIEQKIGKIEDTDSQTYLSIIKQHIKIVNAVLTYIKLVTNYNVYVTRNALIYCQKSVEFLKKNK
jgi:hypothetical protein